ncbi:Universal stress protein UspA-Required for resistance to DNA-damaging agents [Hartmannibacter diazotrophicus]|uniref:Universal stress protein UspA-Required for resistance to DNA-damaging agents n=1 Tax=Hartmannibacter diazotrophicus TaxID=1482074 RepID=A0A2C9D4U0_9HYPH|nr:Universal stress protein UspA-Required for resistance to DNA-damaging agents [Hartmannibacter diazotrophicus]
MSVKDIFVIVDVFDESQPATAAAIDLAQRSGAHVTGLALAMEPMAPAYLAVPIPADYLVGAVEEAERQAQTALDRFDHLAGNADVDYEGRIVTVLAGSTGSIVAQAHLSDIVVVGQEDVDKPEPMRAALIEAMLFDAGVPVLIVPRGWTKSVKTDSVVIAWDGSSTAARAVHAAMPILTMSKSIEIVIVPNAISHDGEPGADVATYLARHGLNVTVTTLNRDASDVAEALNHYFKGIGADLCVMGGYGHSRLREFIVGGATQDMLGKTEIPLIIAH